MRILKIAATSDGNVVVGWTTDSSVILQKLDPNGSPVWIGGNAFGYGVTLQESGYGYTLADLHAADNGSVIVSWVRNHGFGSNATCTQIRFRLPVRYFGPALHVFDGGSLAVRRFPLLYLRRQRRRGILLVHVAARLCRFSRSTSCRTAPKPSA